MEWQPAALCVITVDDGPGGQRWALVSTNLSADREGVERSRHLEPDQVLHRVREFLSGAGLSGAGLDGAAAPTDPASAEPS